MAGVVGAVALMLDFGGAPAAATTTRPVRPALRLASPAGGLGGPGKYEVLAHRRRQAQIRARHLLDELDVRPEGCGRGAVRESPLSERCLPITVNGS